MNRMRFFFSIPLVGLLLLSACGRQEPAPVAAPSVPEPAPSVVSHVLTDTPATLLDRFKGTLKPGVEYRAVVEMEKGDTFEIQFYPEVAPNHVANFVSLARKGYYDGVTFHRVIEGFMAQGGDPTGTGSGGPGYTIPQEFNAMPHERGTLSMARTSDPNSAGSQFYICFARQAGLDFQYTVFGKVITGMESVDKIRRRDPGEGPGSPGDKMKHVEIREIAPEAAPAP